MNKEEYFKRIINRICKDYGYDVATAFEGLYLEKNKEIERLQNIINELEKYIHNELVLDFYNDDMPCELIINKMEKMIKELKDSDVK